MSGDFEAPYAHTGRPAVVPEKLLLALLLQAFYSIRSERQPMEQLAFNLLFRWFVGLGIDERVSDATVFTKSRERLLAGEVASRFLARLIVQPAVTWLLSRDHFSVNGTLIKAWASIKSFRPVDEDPPGDDAGGDRADGGARNRSRDFHGARWSNATYRSTTDAGCRLDSLDQSAERDRRNGSCRLRLPSELSMIEFSAQRAKRFCQSAVLRSYALPLPKNDRTRRSYAVPPARRSCRTPGESLPGSADGPGAGSNISSAAGSSSGEPAVASASAPGPGSPGSSQG